MNKKFKIKENSMIDDNEFNANDKDYLYSEYSDVYKEKYGIRPRWVHPSDLSVEQLKQMLDELYDEPGNGWADDFEESDAPPRDYKGNESYYNDMQAKDNDDVEIDNLVNLGSEEGEEFHGFAGMGKGRRGRNKIHETEQDEVAPPGGEKLVKALKKQKGVKNPWAIAWSKYNKGELKENTLSNKITIGQLRQVIKEELDNQKYLHGYESDHPVDDEGEMIKTRMSGLKRMSEEIEGALKNEDQLPAWVQDLVAQSYSTLEHVHAYLVDNNPKKAKMK